MNYVLHSVLRIALSNRAPVKEEEKVPLVKVNFGPENAMSISL